jgi:hypothetical protein
MGWSNMNNISSKTLIDKLCVIGDGGFSFVERINDLEDIVGIHDHNCSALITGVYTKCSDVRAGVNVKYSDLCVGVNIKYFDLIVGSYMFSCVDSQELLQHFPEFL